MDAIVFASKLKEDVISKANPLPSHSDANLRQNLWTTALGIALLRYLFSASESKWGMLAQKSEKWIKRTLHTNKLTFDKDLVTEALNFLKAQNVSN